MKKQLLLFIFCLLAFTALAQKTRVSGKIINTGKDYLTIRSLVRDFRAAVKINDDGSFDYVTDQIRQPFVAEINVGKILFQVFLAPGYDLKIAGDGLNNQSLNKTLVFSGTGEKSNGYWKDYSIAFGEDTVTWENKDPETYLNRLLDQKRTVLSLINKHFDDSNKEPYSDYFKASRLNQARWEPLAMLLDRYGYQNGLKWPQLQTMIARMDMSNFQKELGNSANLNAEAFGIMVYRFPTHAQVYKIFPKDSAIRDRPGYFDIVRSRFEDAEIRDYVNFKDIYLYTEFAAEQADFDKLNSRLKGIKNPKFQNTLKAMLAERMKSTLAYQPGTPSPIFNLPDTSGVMHKLTDFKGKIVYIDFWASWCGPCKQETPHLKNIAEHYKGNDQLKIISIATWDAKNRKQRYELIKKDQMDWLQLEDTDDTFSKVYKVEGIPRFIIIDKQGNVVDAYAERPSEREQLIAVLDREINK